MDPDNVFQLLMNGQGDPSQAPATNVLQQAAPAPPPSFQDPTAPAQPAAVAQAANAASPPMPKQRHSLIDIIGRLSDTVAKIGGSTPMYQPTLDADTARATAAQDHDLAVQKAQMDLATGKFDLSDKQRAAANDERSRFANVLGAVNDAEDAGNLPAMMAANGLTDPRYAPFVKMIQDNPDTAKTLASALGGGDDSEMGKTIKFGYDKDGNRVAFTVDGEGNTHVLSGVTPDANYKVVNTGDKTSLVGPNGQPKLVIPNKISPNTAATVAQSDANNRRTTSTQLTIAGMPARAQPGKGAAANPTATAQDALSALANVQAGFDKLHSLQALPGEGGALNQVESAIGRTGIGQKIGAQMGTPAAQERLALNKNLKNLQSYMISSLPGSATRTKFEQEIQNMRLPDPMQMDYPTATRVINELKASYQRVLAGASAAAKSTPSSTVVPGWENAPTLSPADAAKLAPGTKFKTLDGRPMTRH